MLEAPIIQVENVSREFQVGTEVIRAVRDVSFSVARGEFLAIIGRSGSGKTTLLNLIAGLDRPTSGRVIIEGQDVSAMSEAELTKLRRHKLGFVFQSFGLLPLLSAYENVEIALRIAGAGLRERAKRAHEVLDMVGLAKRANHRPYELSGGEQQRVAIARALANRPAIILADEPTGELDSNTAASIFRLLVEIAASENVTIVTTTHDRMVMERAGRVIELSDGMLLPEPRAFAPARKQAVSVAFTPPSAPPVTRPVFERPPEPQPEDDHARWAPPERSKRPIYQPPPPPREPL
ncbi:MAG TPA: ABC transporter ATP-binding protein [Dehalococcoidia bacterium]|nr:ABC transporter ATP-binding protein [Dehalococcoidia bacterium]